MGTQMSGKLLVAIFFMFSLIGCNKSYKVVSIIDGDTIIVYPRTPIRIIGIDAPEIKSESEKFADDVATHLTTIEKESKLAQESKQELTNLLFNKKVTLKECDNFDTEILENGRSGRALRFVFLSKEDIGKLMLQKGYARVWKPTFQNKNIHHKKEAEYQKEENIAKELEYGIWKISLIENPE
jgi:endonuclease YncB( thermonuclease family)